MKMESLQLEMWLIMESGCTYIALLGFVPSLHFGEIAIKLQCIPLIERGLSAMNKSFLMMTKYAVLLFVEYDES